jgi:hypothetical protein
MSAETEATGVQTVGASFRDPSGFVFTSAGILYRQINQVYQQNYDRLIDSGLYQALVSAGMLISHQVVEIEPLDPSSCYKIIQPEPVEFISYPYEWSFSQLKDAALTTLEIQKIALTHGMTLKDSSAYNIQYHHGHPVLIDTLSFEMYQEGQPWVPYRQFCQHFLAPLSLMAYCDIRMSQLLRVYIDGVPLDLTSDLLPRKTRLVLSLNLHIHLHASSQKRYAAKPVETTRKVSFMQLQGIIDSLESGVKRLQWSPSGTDWGDYYDEHNYTSAGLEDKKQIVSSFLDQMQPRSVWDLGANTGLFSRLASDRGIPTIAFDIDPGAVELNYLSCRKNNEQDILPLISDLTNPSPAIGWENQERQSLAERGPVDAIFALALIHHLVISNNVPLNRLASFFQYLGRWLVIEFVPKSDSQVQKLLASRQDIFTDYNFESFEGVFSKYFVIHRCEEIKNSQRKLYLMEKRQST